MIPMTAVESIHVAHAQCRAPLGALIGLGQIQEWNTHVQVSFGAVAL